MKTRIHLGTGVGTVIFDVAEDIAAVKTAMSAAGAFVRLIGPRLVYLRVDAIIALEQLD